MIQVKEPGVLTTVQDEGRIGFLAFGLPKAGVMDRYAARIANLLCGNPVGAAVLEMTLLGGAYQFDTPCRIAITGADMEPKLNGAAVASWAAFDILPGDSLELGYVKSGCRTYLAVSGGIDVPLVMGSRSTYTRAQVGGWEGRRLKTGDELPVGPALPPKTGPVRLDGAFIPDYTEKLVLRVLLGPQEDLFEEKGIDDFLQSSFAVSDEADRMGCRLEGPAIKHKDKADIVSDALCFGAVQVPGNGQPIVMMADCGTTGGYAKIATVVGADLWRLAQAKPQDRVSFVRCTEEEAIEALALEVERYSQVAALVAEGPLLSPAEKTNIRRLAVRIDGSMYHVEIEEVE